MRISVRRIGLYIITLLLTCFVAPLSTICVRIALVLPAAFFLFAAALTWSGVFGRPIAPTYLAQIVFIPEGGSREIRDIPFDIDDEAAFNWAAKETVQNHGLVHLAVRGGIEVLYDSENPKLSVVPSFRSGKWTTRGIPFIPIFRRTQSWLGIRGG
jgi:hypothetical protein